MISINMFNQKKGKTMNKKVFAILLIALLGALGYIATVPIGYCATIDFSEIMAMFSEMMPLIIYLAMIGAIMGIIAGVTKKLGKW